jgi:hypothetical protein
MRLSAQNAARRAYKNLNVKFDVEKQNKYSGAHE